MRATAASTCRSAVSTCWADKTTAPGSNLAGFQYPADAAGNYWVGRMSFFDMCPVHLAYNNGGCTDSTARTAYVMHCVSSPLPPSPVPPLLSPHPPPCCPGVLPHVPIAGSCVFLRGNAFPCERTHFVIVVIDHPNPTSPLRPLQLHPTRRGCILLLTLLHLHLAEHPVCANRRLLRHLLRGHLSVVDLLHVRGAECSTQAPCP